MEASAAVAPAQAPQHTWPSIAIVNDASSGVADADAEKMMEAVAHQVLYDFGPRWNAGGHFSFVPAGQKPPAGAWCVVLLGSSDQAGALGYHDLTPEGLPLGKVFAGTDREYGSSVPVTLSHEVLEMLGDPWISLAAQTPDGKFYAWEACDAVEADALGYEVNGLQMSAFVCPGWFGSGDGSQLCFPEGRVTKPLELAPGGYVSVFDPASGQGWQQTQARDLALAMLPGQLSPAFVEHNVEAGEARVLAQSVARVGSRRERRFRGRANWVLSTYEVG